MIVTCPGCTAKYRIKNDAIPPEGTRMRCPKCQSLFVARAPPPGAAETTELAPASETQRIDQLITSATAAAAPPAAPPPVAAPARPAAGPVTALFGAVDVSHLPPEALRPKEPEITQEPLAPSAFDQGTGLDLGGPSHAPAAPTVTVRNVPSRAPQSQVVPSRTARAPLGPMVASWLALAVAGTFALFGMLFWAWATETVSLDAALMPTFEASFGVRPPHSMIGRGAPAVDDLRRDAEAALARGDVPSAIVLWRRVQARTPKDPRARAAIAKLRSDLEDQEG